MADTSYIYTEDDARRCYQHLIDGTRDLVDMLIERRRRLEDLEVYHYKARSLVEAYSIAIENVGKLHIRILESSSKITTDKTPAENIKAVKLHLNTLQVIVKSDIEHGFRMYSSEKRIVRAARSILDKVNSAFALVVGRRKSIFFGAFRSSERKDLLKVAKKASKDVEQALKVEKSPDQRLEAPESISTPAV